eukprot:CAMPEP_0196753574 /NCGR_PEP_ID=MMETSP1091-20130531/91235_1 /TAXON_ID=302021 /ORGANISM="Rhodomonas sp., Strain CCMP768" /LENGTH=91 /DNA_ID=CAMNT_0042101711 /DNA_START=172 /DNA_END=447 /DNA_ORIENTATION=+
MDCSLSPLCLRTDSRPVSEPESRAPGGSWAATQQVALATTWELRAALVGLDPRLLALPPPRIVTIQARRALPTSPHGKGAVPGFLREFQAI